MDRTLAPLRLVGGNCLLLFGAGQKKEEKKKKDYLPRDAISLPCRLYRPGTPAQVMELLVPSGRWAVLKNELVQRDKAQPGGRRGALPLQTFLNVVATYSALRRPTEDEVRWLSSRFGRDRGSMIDYVAFLGEASGAEPIVASRPGTAASADLAPPQEPRQSPTPSSASSSSTASRVRARKLPGALGPVAEQLRRTWRQLRARCKADEEVAGKVPFRAFMAILKLHGVWLCEAQVYVLLREYSEKTSNAKGAPRAFLVQYEKFLADLLADQQNALGRVTYQ